jgi:quinol monooxygenase YgiN
MTAERGSALYFETASRLVCVAGCLDDGAGAASTGAFMIFITAKFRVLPEYADDWATISGPFTRACRSEPGCLWFDWSRSLDDPTEFVLVEAFRDGEAAAAHVQSAHFKEAQQTLPSHLAETPRIVNFTIPQDDWSELGEMAVPGRG